MKQCPKCGNSYTDDTLRFCLEDGTVLTLADEQPTVVRSGGRDPHKTEELPGLVTRQAHEAVRVTIPGTETSAQQRPTQPPGKSRLVLLTVLIAVIALAGLVIAAAGILGIAYYVSSGKNNVVISSPTPTPSISPTVSPDDGKSKLEDDLAELKRKLEEAANSNSDSTITLGDDDLDFGGFGKTAKVNSPSDGFLALRNLPSVDIGNRIAKIPHEATIKVLMCSDQKATIAGRTGHWCMVTYDGQSGWVFDVWLTFAADSKN